MWGRRVSFPFVRNRVRARRALWAASMWVLRRFGQRHGMSGVLRVGRFCWCRHQNSVL